MFTPENIVSLTPRGANFNDEYIRCFLIRDELHQLCTQSLETIQTADNLQKLPKADRVAYALGLRFYSSGHLCSHGHKPLREVVSPRLSPENRVQTRCVECTKESNKKTAKTRQIKNKKNRDEYQLKLQQEVNKHRKYIEDAYVELRVVCKERAVWFPQTRAEAAKYSLPIFRKPDGTLWRLASGEGTTSMDKFRAWRLLGQTAQKEAARVSSDIPELNKLSAKQIMDRNLIGKLPVGLRAAVLAGSRFCQAVKGGCCKGHPNIKKVSKHGATCVLCNKEQKERRHKTRMLEDELYADKIRKNSSAQQKRARVANPDKFREKDRIRDQQPERREYNRKRKHRYRDRLSNATPPWLTFEQYEEIDEIYARAIRKTEETGIVYHVDHIEPIKGDSVCGLHVPWNLRAIPAQLNLSKSNRDLNEYLD